MKKSDLIKVIREIVKQELKKELPNALAQVFAQMMGQVQRPEVHSINTVRYLQPAKVVGTSLPHQPSKEEMPNDVPEEVDEMTSLKSQLAEMFNSGSPVKKVQQTAAPKPKQFTKNPILNEVLNQTRGFNSSERMANRVGGMGAGMSPAVAMAAGAYAAPSATGAGEMMRGEELGFMRNVPGMPGADSPVLTELPAHAAPVMHEGQEGGPAPMEGLAVDSALDLKNHPALPDSIKGILSRDYRSLVRAMDKKK